MSEELLQRDLLNNPEKIGKWDFFNIGATTIKALKEHCIIRNVDYGEEEKKKVDALIVQKKNVIAVIEYKKPSEFKTTEQKNKAIKQELEVARKLSANIIIATDTKDTVWVNVLTGNRIKDENGKEIKAKFDPKDEKLPDLIEKIKYSINELNDSIKPKQLVNPTDLAKQIWQDIWSVSGATPENCLYTFVELFIFKYLSDLGILGQGIDFKHLLERYSYKLDNPEEQALEYYANTIRPEIKKLFPESPLDKTTIINGTIFVSKDQKAVKGYSTVFKKVLLKFNAYPKLENIDYDFKSKLFESFLKESISKKNWGQFFTPLKVVRAIVEMAKDEIKEGIKICDPACGVGKFLLEPLKTKLDNFYEISKKGIKSKITIHGFDKGFDKDEQKTIILAKANMLIYFSDLIKENSGLTKDFSKLFNESFVLKTNSILGTLSDPIENEYDLILTNPPYVMSGSSNLKEEIGKDGDLKNYYKINAMGVEGLFMEWIIRALKPGGKAFIVVPDGILNRQNDKNLRQFIINKCHIDGIISLPIKTFFTTPKKTYILCLTKKISDKEIQTDPVFTYIVSEIGESRDVYRFEIEQNDLQEAVTLYSFFKGNKKSFDKINSDNRCKVVPFQFFADNVENNWVIDNHWSNDEKIKLNILDENKSIKFEELPELLDDVVINIQSLMSELSSFDGKKKSKIKFHQICINDIFDSPPTNSGLKKEAVKLEQTKEYCIPVYSATKNEDQVFGWVSKNSKWRKYEDVLTWNKDGSANIVFYRKNKFVPYEKVKLLSLKKNYVNKLLYEYLKIIIQIKMINEGFSFNHKCSMDRVLKLKIPIPFDENNNIDTEKQKEIIEKYKYVWELKQKTEEYKKQIIDLNVEVDSINSEFLNCSLIDNNIFDLTRGKRITKEIIDKNKGNIPVYSSSKTEESILGQISEDFLKSAKLLLFEEPSILFNLDGSVGYCFLRNNAKYSFIDVVASLKPKNKKIDLEYLLYKLREEILKTGANYQSKLYFNKIKNYEISINIPIDSKGEFDIKIQKEIAEKYKKIEQIKKNIANELDKISSAEIDFE